MDDLPLDFTRYLATRLGATHELTHQLLGNWLREYEPLADRADDRPSHVPACADDAVADDLKQVG